VKLLLKRLDRLAELLFSWQTGTHPAPRRRGRRKASSRRGAKAAGVPAWWKDGHPDVPPQQLVAPGEVAHIERGERGFDAQLSPADSAALVEWSRQQSELEAFNCG
jgi:hypothetical protein